VIRSLRFLGRLAALALLFSLAAGCGPGQGRISGRVLLGGKPVPGGLVMFMPADGRSSVVSAEIDQNGNYSAVTLPVGDVMVSVDNRQFAPLPPRGPPPIPKGIPLEVLAKMGAGTGGGGSSSANDAAAAARAARYVNIPARYYTAEKSDIRFTVKPGEQQYDVNLSN
jgi:hypothetical protein